MRLLILALTLTTFAAPSFADKPQPNYACSRDGAWMCPPPY